ncbi:uncharacterized protein B0H18DRAFT_1208315 [Fomitopsis serialis]|uniref:uncharacterized protein n=1 Tax=Fomitopsis serialis TaxID=139415 RepID=UPI0020081720|nr:uncharacterized protein B0H18DRAFT_1208315 [Neoantrodia serialis]KAH9933011.1 hypothetical protein B0H18DRAFT_1208315 [Neoantrodia serialis]
MPDEGSFSLGSPRALSPGTPRMNERATEDTPFTKASAQNSDGDACGDPSHTTSPLSDETWKQYETRFSNVDTKFVKTWDKDLDTLLLFAALFSAVLTAFVIESYQYMKPESTKTESNGTPPANAHALEVEAQASSVSTFVRINVLWFASLVTSVSTAF